MDFQLTSEQRMIRDLARTFAEREIKPVAAQYDREERFPWDIYERARAVGLLLLTVPASLGGAGLGAVEQTIVAEESAWGCVGITAAISLNGLVADALLVGGSPAQEDTYIGAML